MKIQGLGARALLRAKGTMLRRHPEKKKKGKEGILGELGDKLDQVRLIEPDPLLLHIIL